MTAACPVSEGESPRREPEIAESIELALRKLRQGKIVAFPTDTLYALGADALNAAAVAAVFAIKKRPLSHPLPLFVSGVSMAARLGVVNRTARLLAGRFWPGALTLVLSRLPEFHSLALAGGDTVAVRAPNHPIALDLVRGLGRPVTATSANLSGGVDPDSAAEVRRQLGAAVDYVLDGGPCPIGQASTIVDCTSEDGIAIIRQGAIEEAAIRKVLDLAR
jgi:L-threonylcarbamoyladenylate synthase